MDKLVSIIVPVYNAEAYLEECLDSIVAQTYKNIEIIIVDDGSSDKSGEICDTYARNDPRIKVIHQQNTGLSGARNAGLEIMTGEYVIFVDSDDWISPDTCEKAIETMLKNDIDVVFWSYVREYPDKSLPRYIYDREQLFEGEAYDELFLKLLGETNTPETLDSMSSACNKCYKVKGISEKVRFVDTKRIGTEDLLYNVQIFLLAKSAYYLNETFYHYRKDNANSLTSIYNKKLLIKRKALFQALRSVLPEDSEDKFFKVLDKRVALDVLGQSLNVIQSDEKAGIKYKLMRNVLHDDVYKPALRRMYTKGMKLHWKVYYGSAKHGWCLAVYILSYLIKILKQKM